MFSRWVAWLYVSLHAAADESLLVTDLLDAAGHVQFLKTHRKALVLYYVPWCHWCRKFLPQLDDAANYTKTMTDPVLEEADAVGFGRIDLNKKENKPVMDSENILSFPTLRLHERLEDGGDRSEEYEGEMDARAVSRWLLGKIQEDMTIKRVEQWQFVMRHVSKTDPTVIFLSPDEQLRQMYKVFEAKFGHFTFIKVDEVAIILTVLEEIQRPDVVDPSGAELIPVLRANPRQPFILLLSPFGQAASETTSEPEGGAADSFEFHYDHSGSHTESRLHLYPESPSQLADIHNVERLADFLQAHEFPMISRWSATFAPRLLHAGKAFLVAITPKVDNLDPTLSGREANDRSLSLIEDVLWDLSSAYRKKFITFICGTSLQFEKRLIATLNIDKTPVLVYVTMNPVGSGIFVPTLKYLADEDLNRALFDEVPFSTEDRRLLETLRKARKWVADVVARRVRPNVKSEEPLPAHQNTGPVYFLTALDFQREVIDSEDDYLVDFYAPWCGHCRVLFPIFEAVARALRQIGYQHLKLGRIDATANEIPQVQLRGYPTLILYRSMRKSEPLVHNGGVSSPDDILSFLEGRVSQRLDIAKITEALRNPSFDDELPKSISGEL